MQWDPVVDRATPLHADVVERLRKRLADLREGFRQNVALIGPAGSGKSSTLLAALAAACEPSDASSAAPAAAFPLIVVYYQARRESWDQWAKRFILATLQGVKGFRPSVMELPDEQALLRTAYSIAPRAAQQCAELLPQIRTMPQERLFRQILDLPYLIAEETGRPGVIVLDEFHELEHLGIHRPFHELGKRIMLERSMLYFLASSQPAMARRILRERLNLLFGGFEVVDVGPLEPDACERLVRRQLVQRQPQLSVVHFLSWFTHGHAWSLAMLADALRVRGARGELTADELLQQAAVELADGRRPLSAWCAERLQPFEEGRTGRSYLALLHALAGRRATPRALADALHQTVAETSRQVSRLLEQGLVERHGELYTVGSPLWSFWFRHVYAPRQAAIVTTVSISIDWTRQQLDNTWAGFLRTQQEPPLQRFMQLLASFQNELVRLESRRLRLPSFARVQREGIGPGVHQITAEPAAGLPWLYFVKEAQVEESDVSAFLTRSARVTRRVGPRIVVSLDGFDASAQLLAKISKFWVWHHPTLASLYHLYSLPSLHEVA